MGSNLLIPEPIHQSLDVDTFNFKSRIRQGVVFKSETHQVHLESTFSDMGQKISALKKSRKASEHAQCSSTLNEPTNGVLSREDDCAIPSSKGLESTQLSSIDTSSEALPPISELKAENASITLPKLCSELILDIAEYLPPSSYMSLSYTCRIMRNKMGVSFAQVLGDKNQKGRLSGSTLSIESRNIRYLERLELWSMLVRDGKIPRRKAMFSGYQTKIIDDYSMVKTPIYAPRSTDLRCLGTAGLLWVCPHRLLSHSDATMKRETDNNHLCGSGYVSSFSPIVIIWWIMRIPINSVPTCKEVVEALRPLNAPICPHLRLNDASVARIYDSECRKLHRDKTWNDPASACRCSMCLSDHPLAVICSYCDTRIMFDIEPDNRGRARFCLLIMRTSEFGRSCSDREWKSQVAPPTDWKEYETAWEATNAECSRRAEQSFDDL